MNTITQALLDVFNESAAVIGSILKALGFDASAITTALKTVFSLGAEAVGTILKGLGFGADLIAGLYQELERVARGRYR
ncbi:hypothetical protein [Deinococcus sp. QL22]|uniref:hypothetical protein n=1 Tax=Deinococcus sp. QL22 TaxID=2939437 RepID=UPI002016E1E6|nr:hypothetical protein [Deinococcus sp. QL22]UQN09375.1 hypothetical protein M1R55_22715 [Deinococcus sp. QL22]